LRAKNEREREEIWEKKAGGRRIRSRSERERERERLYVGLCEFK